MCADISVPVFFREKCRTQLLNTNPEEKISELEEAGILGPALHISIVIIINIGRAITGRLRNRTKHIQILSTALGTCVQELVRLATMQWHSAVSYQ